MESNVRSNADLSDEELKEREGGHEKGTSILDQVTAGFALENRKEAKRKAESEKLISSIPQRRYKEHR